MAYSGPQAKRKKYARQKYLDSKISFQRSGAHKLQISEIKVSGVSGKLSG
jgi:hypothetical protein